MNTEKPASQADVAKLHAARRIASREFTAADMAYDVALRAYENAVLRKDAARKKHAAAAKAYEEAKAEGGW